MKFERWVLYSTGYMTEADTKESVEQKYTADLLPESFVERAPVNEGADKLMGWLDENLRKEVIRSTKKKLKRVYKIPSEHMPPDAQVALEQIAADQGKANASALETYAAITHGTYLWEHKHKDPEAAENLRLRRKGMNELLFSMAMLPEANVIDALFEKATGVKIKHPYS